jgi:hypothetical protein
MRRNERFSERAMKAALSTRFLPVGVSSIVGSNTYGKGVSRKGVSRERESVSKTVMQTQFSSLLKRLILKRLS